MTRKQALEWIRVAVAKTGDPSAGTRIYVEHRISRAAYNQAVRDGLARREWFAERDAQKGAQQS